MCCCWTEQCHMHFAWSDRIYILSLCLSSLLCSSLQTIATRKTQPPSFAHTSTNCNTQDTTVDTLLIQVKHNMTSVGSHSEHQLSSKSFRFIFIVIAVVLMLAEASRGIVIPTLATYCEMVINLCIDVAQHHAWHTFRVTTYTSTSIWLFPAWWVHFIPEFSSFVI